LVFEKANSFAADFFLILTETATFFLFSKLTPSDMRAQLFFPALLLVLILFTSCQKEEPQPDDGCLTTCNFYFGHVRDALTGSYVDSARVYAMWRDGINVKWQASDTVFVHDGIYKLTIEHDDGFEVNSGFDLRLYALHDDYVADGVGNSRSIDFDPDQVDPEEKSIVVYPKATLKVNLVNDEPMVPVNATTIYARYPNGTGLTPVFWVLELDSFSNKTVYAPIPAAFEVEVITEIRQYIGMGGIRTKTFQVPPGDTAVWNIEF
jgi:hypothetical protein